MHTKFWSENLKTSDHTLENNIRMDLKRNRVSSGPRWRVMASSLEHGNEPACSVKGGEILEQLRDYQLLMNDSAPWS
jgi:hypothetical protein